MRAEELRAALEALEAESPVVLPTDTVYGIGALARSRGAVEAVFAAKGRPEDKPLPVLAATTEDLEGVVSFDDRARRLARSFWPGPLTLVLARAPACDWYLGTGRNDTIAVRLPDCPVAAEVLRAAGPLAVTSANRSGGLPATTVEEARAALGGRVSIFLDGGRRSGEVSTIVSLVREVSVSRVGAIAEPQVLDALG